MEIKAVDICGIKHSCLDYDQAISIFSTWIQTRQRSYQVCIANVHTTIMCQHDKELANIANNADMVTMDGQPLRWYANIIHGANMKERVTGPDLMARCIHAGIDKGWKHFFLGGREDVLSSLCERISRDNAGVRVVGSYSPPYRKLSQEENQAIVDMINSSGADFLWVGFGAPKQEKWIAENLHMIQVPIAIGVGAAFAFLSGKIKRAPQTWQRVGLEWLFRLFQDPRLFKRYLMTNPVFIYNFVRDYFKEFKKKRRGQCF